MINAKELRKKYYNDNIVPVDFTECLKQIEQKIVEAAQNQKEAIDVAVPRMYKKRIKEELEDEDYTVISGVLRKDNLNLESDLEYITVMWFKDLVVDE